MLASASRRSFIFVARGTTVLTAIAVTFWGSLFEGARAQSLRLPQNAADLVLEVISPKKMTRKSLRTVNVRTRNYQGLAMNGWVFYPRLMMGAIYNDNLFRTTLDRQSGFGLRVVPSLLAERDTGIHHTTVFANGNFSLYQKPAADLINAQVGFSHHWRPTYDMQFKAFANAAHVETGYNSGILVNPLAGGFVGTGNIVGYQQGSTRYNQISGGVSGLKSFDRFFVGGGASAITYFYDSLYTNAGPVSQSSRNNVQTTFFANAGYMLTPLLYAFSEASGNMREFFSGNFYNSQGYRVIVGLGSDRISLFRGEIYGGYQRQIFNSAIFGAPSSPVIGGRIYWYPTRAWTVYASLDETFVDFAQPTVGNITGSAALATAATISANYAFARNWSASVRGSYTDYKYIKGSRNDHYWNVNPSLTYEIMRNLSATFEYTFRRTFSNALGASYYNNIFVLGAAYKY